VRTLLAAALLVGGLSLPASAAALYEVSYVPGADGQTLRVEVLRDPAVRHAPVILTLSPYNVLGDSKPADTTASRRYVSQGYAVAVADVLGTRGSSGCWDYGGKKEQQPGVDVVKWLAHRPWSNGRVGMTGVSYDGTTANMVAATGIPELKAIAPVAAISHWYGYAYYDGVRYSGNTRVPTDEGIDTPLGFDYGFARIPKVDPADPQLSNQVTTTASDCQGIEHTQQGYARSPGYGPFWQERDYVRQASRFRAAVFLVHGWQDYNVKQDEALRLWKALPVGPGHVPFKRMWLTQESHSDGTGPGYQQALDRFWDATLKHPTYRDPQIPVVTTLGADQVRRVETSWPPAGTRDTTLYLGRSFVHRTGVPTSVPDPVGAEREDGTLSLERTYDGDGWTYADTGAATEEASLADPSQTNSLGTYSLFHQTPVLKRAARLVGSARLDAWVYLEVAGQHLTPLLVDVAPDGSLSLVERGFLNMGYRDGLGKDDATAGWQRGVVTMLPQDYTFAAGHRIGVVLLSSNTTWAIPGAAGTVNWAMGPVDGVTYVGTRLILPLVGSPLR
jgi:X-Pro dipeptidyl-peptidase